MTYRLWLTTIAATQALFWTPDGQRTLLAASPGAGLFPTSSDGLDNAPVDRKERAAVYGRYLRRG